MGAPWPRATTSCCHQVWPRDHNYAGIDIFRLDQDGKVVEHWDVLLVITALKAGHHVSARGAYLRASECYRQAFFFHRDDLDRHELRTAYIDCPYRYWPVAQVPGRRSACEPSTVPLSGRLAGVQGLARAVDGDDSR